MASAFQCDVCAFCEPGDPIVRFKVESSGTKGVSEEWCTECLSSYEDWRRGRTPILDEVTES